MISLRIEMISNSHYWSFSPFLYCLLQAPHNPTYEPGVQILLKMLYKQYLNSWFIGQCLGLPRLLKLVPWLWVYLNQCCVTLTTRTCSLSQTESVFSFDQNAAEFLRMWLLTKQNLSAFLVLYHQPLSLLQVTYKWGISVLEALRQQWTLWPVTTMDPVTCEYIILVKASLFCLPQIP